MKKSLVFILMLAILSSCITEIDRQLDSQHVSLKKIKIFPEEAGIKTKWTVYENDCRVEIVADKEKMAEMESDSGNLSLYQVQMVLFDEKGVITMDEGFTRYSSGEQINKNGYFLMSNIVTYTSSVITTEFVFPMHYFHNVKAGKRDLYAGVIVTRIQDQDRHQIFKGYFRFNINVPEIYRSTLICNGIELQNDSIWSPYNSDFSFGKGLPDVYWALYLPSEDSNDVQNFYASVPVLWNSYGYINTDTINLFTYQPDEKLMIGVYDYDRVFGDEYIGSWHGSFSDLKENQTGFLQFIHITRFNYEFIVPESINGEKK